MVLKKLDKNSKKKLKILVIRYGTIGDTIFSLPVYRELRKIYGDSVQIDAIADKTTQTILSMCNYVDNIIPVELIKPKHLFKAVSILKKYDKAYFLRKSRKCTIGTFISGVKDRIGFKLKGNDFLTKEVVYDGSKHVIDLYLDVLRADNLSVSDNSLGDINFIVPDIDLSFKNKYIAIQGFSRSVFKDWNIDGWKQVIDYIVNVLNWDVVLLGTDKDFEKYEEIAQNYTGVHNLSGKTNIVETFSYIKNCDCFIGIDSGLIHAAALFKKKSVLLHGSTSIIHWKPQNVNCRIITKNFSCSPCCFMPSNQKDKTICINSPSCLNAITPQDVVSELEYVLKTDMVSL